MLQLKNSENDLKLQVSTLMSRLDDERHKNMRTENLLQLRLEYANSLEQTNEINKARTLTYMKQVEDLRFKVEKLRTYKAAKKEELENMFSTMKSQEFEIDQLKHQVQQKDVKLAKFRGKMKLASGSATPEPSELA